jgi:hypothetical protein
MSILLAEMISGNFPEIIFTHSALGLLWLDVKHGRITIHHVAKKAGVAISSVSRVLSNHADVSDDMRIKVEKAVSELGLNTKFPFTASWILKKRSRVKKYLDCISYLNYLYYIRRLLDRYYNYMYLSDDYILF